MFWIMYNHKHNQRTRR